MSPIYRPVELDYCIAALRHVCKKLVKRCAKNLLHSLFEHCVVVEGNKADVLIGFQSPSLHFSDKGDVVINAAMAPAPVPLTLPDCKVQIEQNCGKFLMRPRKIRGLLSQFRKFS